MNFATMEFKIFIVMTRFENQTFIVSLVWLFFNTQNLRIVLFQLVAKSLPMGVF
jgi:hypothetical protein